MVPVIAIVGRPNVGKSTLFNQLTRSRDALVADTPGLTRDRQYGTGTVGNRPFLVVDTGGLSDDRDDVTRLIGQQALRAVQEADITLFMVDARDGLTGADQNIAAQLRAYPNTLVLVANKTEGLDQRIATSEFHALGLGYPWPIAAAHGRGLRALMEATATHFPAIQENEEDPTTWGIKVAIIGRPNVGKSTLVNRILGEERVVAHDSPGTTRDSIYIPFIRHAKRYTLIDTAGVRRRARVSQKIEKFSVIKSLQAIETANVAIVLIDAQEGVTDQDVHLLGFVLESGRAFVIAINKWDGLAQDHRRQVREALERKLAFIDFARPHLVSALYGSGVGDLFASVDTAWESASRKLSTPILTRTLLDAVSKHPPPVVRGRRIKLRYAHQGGKNPPTIVIHGNQTAAVPNAYRRYLIRTFRTVLGLEGTPIRIDFRTGENPYKDRRNVLTPRQRRKRKRLIEHAR